jgi:hypothetical protein
MLWPMSISIARTVCGSGRRGSLMMLPTTMESIASTPRSATRRRGSYSSTSKIEASALTAGRSPRLVMPSKPTYHAGPPTSSSVRDARPALRA